MSRVGTYPLSPVQQGMLFHRQKAPTSGVDVEQMIATLREPLDVVAMTRAFRSLLAHHPVLRTRFRWEGLPAPEQEVTDVETLHVAEHDLRDLAPGEQGRRIDAFLREDRIAGVDLSVAPLLRVNVFHLGDADHRLIWTFPHLLLDGGSFPIVVEQLFGAYEAARRGETPILPPTPPYGDHIAWLERHLSSQARDAARFFRQELQGFTAPNEIGVPVGSASPPPDRLHGVARLALSEARTASLSTLAREHGATLNTLVQVAWGLVVSDYSGRSDVVLGVVRACRRTALPEAERMLGLFINTLPLRVQLDPQATLPEVIRDVRRRYVAARPFEHTPLLEAQAASELPRGAALFSTIMVFNEARMGTLMRAKGPAFATREFDWIEQTNYPLTLFAYAEPELLLVLSYDPARFDAATIERLMARLDAALAALTAQPQARIADLRREPSGEQASIERWNATELPLPEDACVHHLFLAQARRTPEAVALAFRDREITYGALQARVLELSTRLRALGVGPDVRVGVFIPRSIDMVVALLAVLEAGGAYVPMDPSYPAERIAMMLEDSGAAVITTVTPVASRLPPHDARLVCLDALEPVPHDARMAPSAEVTPASLAYVIFTSGSTGRPKGVMIEHRNVVNFFAGMDQRVGTEPGVWLAVTSISFDISVLELLWTLTRGFKVVIQEETNKAVLASRASPASSPMQFSLFYFAADAGGSGSSKYRLLLEGAKFADRHGFSAIWTPERHFHAFGGLYPNPAVTSAAIAAVTERIQIRAGSVVLPLHNPIRVAEEWAVVDNLSGGRVGLSFASGWHANDFALMPGNYENRKELMFQGIETVKRLWRGESVAVKSGTGEDIFVKILPLPVRDNPPIWVTAAGNVDTFRTAGEMGANVLTNMLGQSVEDLTTKLAAYRAARAAHGHPGPGHVSLMLHTFVGTDVEAVREKIRGPFTEYLRTSTDLVKRARWYFPAFAGADRLSGADDALSPEDLDALLAHAFERYFHTHGLFGTPESCVSMVERLKQIGVDEVACLVDFGVAEDDVLASLVHLAALKDRTNPAEVAGEADYGIAAQIRRYGVTHLQCTPSLARAPLEDGGGRPAVASLRTLLLGGEALSAPLADDVLGVLRGELLDMYGPTETTVWSTTSRVERGVPVTIGTPIANTEIHLLGPGGRPAPIGVPGELCIGGRGVARGYLGRDDLTAERFVPVTGADGRTRRLYRTGDLARFREDGQIDFLGRLDHQVKVRGYRIELGEIESVLEAHPAVKHSVVVAREETPGEARLLAYVVPGDRSAGTAEETRDEWHAIWDQTYRTRDDGREEPADATFNVAGWRSSYTGEPIPEEEMREWVTRTAERILEGAPKRVLEIGCGTGLLLLRVAPKVEAYTGVDFSGAALEHVERALAEAPISGVRLVRSAADELAGIEPGGYDTVVVNSVVQYFPDAAYLVRVLERALDALSPGGRLFVGDVRSLPHLRAFHTDVELHRAAPSSTTADLLDRIEKRAENDAELVIDPALFHELAARRPDVAGATIDLKRGAFRNELTKFRYDVTLRKVGRSPFGPAGAAAPRRLASGAPEGARVFEIRGDRIRSLAELREQVAAAPPVVRVTDLENPRLSRELEATARLASGAARATVEELRGELASVLDGGVDPEAIHAADLDRDVHLSWSASASGRFDALLVARSPGETDGAVEWVRDPTLVAGPGTSWESLVRRPSHEPTDERLVSRLRAHLSSRLPDFMMPSAFVVLDTLPMTPNGKVDRKALPAPERVRKAGARAFVEPGSDLERRIAEIWQELLGVEQVGASDNFFDLGANSLLVMRANGRISAALGRSVALVDLFRFPTVSSLAAHLGRSAAGPKSAAPPANVAERAMERVDARRDALQRRRELMERARGGAKR